MARASSLRYTRQVRLADVGEEGQGRLVACMMHVSRGGLAGEIEARYLERAGVTVVRDALAHEGEESLDYPFADDAARDVATGAHAALVRIAAVLERE